MNNPWDHFREPPPKRMISQEKWLLECLKRNQSCSYGRAYGFCNIKTIDEYQAKVPIVTYDELSQWIEKITKEENVLFSEPVVAFERTGGSNSGGKLIPYSQTGLNDFRYALLYWFSDVIEHYEIIKGLSYWALSPVLNESLRNVNGIPIGGGDALYLGMDNVPHFMALSAVPFSFSHINELKAWQIVTLYYLIKQNELQLISIWSPSFLLLLLDAIHLYQAELIALFENGGNIGNHRLEKDKAGKEKLQQYLNTHNTEILWPQLKLISTWMDASSSVMAGALQEKFRNTTIQPKGLLSTEAVITTPNKDGKPLLCLESNFYEFMNEKGELFLAHKLIKGEIYQIIITTNSGLYRYQTNDQVYCEGYIGESAILKFVGRMGVSDYVGEKLTESFINECLASLNCLATITYDRNKKGYVLLVDTDVANATTITQQVEERLYHNPQYAYARKLNQLFPLTYEIIPKMHEKYIEYCLQEGKFLGDIKWPTLLLKDWQKVFKGS